MREIRVIKSYSVSEFFCHAMFFLHYDNGDIENYHYNFKSKGEFEKYKAMLEVTQNIIEEKRTNELNQ